MGNPESTYIGDYAVGDSIAHMTVERGVIKAVDPVPNPVKGKESVEDRYSKVGIQSGDVLANVKKLVDDFHGDLHGKHIVLSSGLSNTQIDKERYADPKDYRTDDFPSIEAQLKLLEEKGAKVTLLGVSSQNPVFTARKYNERLQALADKYHATFVSLPPTHRGDGHLHPAYIPLFEAIKKANAGDHSIPVMSREDVTEAQELMKKINARGQEKYDLGQGGKQHDGIDGTMGGGMGRAIHAFEKRHGLSDPDKDTLLKTLRDTAGGPSQSSTPVDAMPSQQASTTSSARSKKQSAR